MRRHAFPVAMIFSLLLAAPRCGGVDGRDRDRVRFWNRLAGLRDPELPTKECGELNVPLDYDEPDGATISVIVGPGRGPG